MHSLRANKDLFISAPSIHVCLSVSLTSAPLSLPAKSMNVIQPNFLPLFLSLKFIYRIACDLDES